MNPRRFFSKHSGLFTSCLIAALAGRVAAGVFPIATNPAVAQFSGGAVVAGTNYLALYVSGTNLAAQAFTTNGMLLGSPLTWPANAGFPPLAILAGAKLNSLAVWSDNTLTLGATAFGQLLSASGSAVGGKFQLVASPGSYGFQAVQAAASDGTNYLVIWQDMNTGNFYAQRISGAGALTGSPLLLANELNGIGQRNVALAFGATNYLFAWQTGNNNSNQVFGVLISPGGTAGGVFQISTTASLDNNPTALAFDGTNYLVTWSTDTQYASAGWPQWELYGRFVSQNGTLSGNELVLITELAALPGMAFDGNNYLLLWGYDTMTTNNDNTIHGAWVDRNGNQQGAIFTPFPAQGTNPPLLPINCVLYDGKRMVLTPTFGTFSTDGSGNVTGPTGGQIYGMFLPNSQQRPSFTPPALVGGKIQLTLSVVPGQTYTVETSSNLTTWTPAGSVSSTGTNLLTVTDHRGVTYSPQLFYRIAIGNLIGATFNFNFHLYANAGGFGSGTTPVVSFPVPLNSYSANLEVNNDNNLPAATNVFFTGPGGSGLSNTPADPNNSSIAGQLYQSPFVSSPASPPGGAWMVNYKGTNINFTAPNPQTGTDLVVPVPTTTVNNGVLQSVSWVYQNAATGSTISGTPAFITDIQVQVEGVVGGRIYNSPQLTGGALNHTLTSTVNWTNVSEIFMAYDDTLGNSYIVSFSKP